MVSFTFFEKRRPLLIILLVFLLIEVVLFVLHTVPSVWVEIDGIGYMSRATGSVLQASPFHGPGYSCAIRLLHGLGIELFAAGKLVSIFFGMVLIVVTWVILEKIENRKVALWGSLTVSLAHPVVLHSVLVMSDIMGSALFWLCWSFLFLPEKRKTWHVFAAGLSGGAAYLSRSLFLIVVILPFLRILGREEGGHRRKNVISLFLFLLGFFLVMSPWGLFLLKIKGNPFWNQHYLNAAFSMVHGWEKGWNLMPYPSQYSGWGDVIRAHPGMFFRNWAENFISLPWLLIRALPLVGSLGFIGFFLLLKDLNPRRIIFLATCLIYSAALSLAWFTPRYTIPLFPLIGAAVARSLLLIPERISLSGEIRGASRFFERIPLRKSLIVLCVLFLLFGSYSKTKQHFRGHADEWQEAARQLERYDLSGAKLLLAREHIVYFLNRDGYDDVGWLRFRHSDVRLQHARLEQFPGILKRIQPTYFLFDQRYGGKEFPHFRCFLDPDQNPYPDLLEFLFAVDDPYRVVVYRYKNEEDSSSTNDPN